MRNLSDPPAMVRPANDLAALANQINAEREAAERAARQSIEHARVAGEALLEARQQCAQSRDWLLWLKQNVRFSKSTAHNYMSVVRSRGRSQAKRKTSHARTRRRKRSPSSWAPSLGPWATLQHLGGAATPPYAPRMA
jgi:hypothetical protein